MNKVRVLHFCYSGKSQPGIINQLEAESKCVLKNGFSWDIAYFTHECNRNGLNFIYSTGINRVDNESLLTKINLYLLLRFKAFCWLVKNRHKWDFVVLRYMAGDPFIFLFSLILKNYFTVHHTKEKEEINSTKGIGRVLKCLFERTLGYLTLLRSVGYIAVTNEIRTYEIERVFLKKPSMVYPNGATINMDDIPDDKRSGKLKMVFVGSRSYAWNGLEIILREVEKSSRDDFELHIVGNIEDLLVDKRVIYHGFLDELYLRNLLTKMDVGLGTFDLRKKNMTEACSLKSRDYLSNGVLVCADHKDAAIPDSFPYYMQSSFELNKVLDFALDGREYNREEIVKESSKYIDKKILFNSLLEFISEFNASK